MKLKSPIFIVGNPRSGTTLLRLMLTSHKNIVIPPECGFAIWYYEKYKKWNPSFLNYFIDDLMRAKKIETWKLDKNEITRYLMSRLPTSYPDLVSSIYEYFGSKNKVYFKRWGDKNNFYLNHIQTIKEMFPNAIFLHIVRDGRDIACSYKNLMKMRINSKYAPNLPSNVEEIAQQWKENLSIINEAFKKIDWENVYEIRFEDLVRNTKSTLELICGRINENYDPQMLEYYRFNREKKLEPVVFLNWKIKTIEAPDITVIGKYKKELDINEILQFNKICRRHLKHYGYS